MDTIFYRKLNLGENLDFLVKMRHEDVVYIFENFWRETQLSNFSRENTV